MIPTNLVFIDYDDLLAAPILAARKRLAAPVETR